MMTMGGGVKAHAVKAWTIALNLLVGNLILFLFFSQGGTPRPGSALLGLTLAMPFACSLTAVLLIRFFMRWIKPCWPDPLCALAGLLCTALILILGSGLAWAMLALIANTELLDLIQAVPMAFFCGAVLSLFGGIWAIPLVGLNMVLFSVYGRRVKIQAHVPGGLRPSALHKPLLHWQ